MAADANAVLLQRLAELERLYGKWRREANRQRRRAETWRTRALRDGRRFAQRQPTQKGELP